jgi:CubicO group peptidase (beta-lactamase class C family)
MKNYILVLITLGILQSCSIESEPNKSKDYIKDVETNLSHVVYIEGDSTWTIEERMAYYGVPGVSLAVINEGKIEWVKTYGVMDKETKSPVTKNTLFQAASISKPVTAYGALRLVEQEKIDLNTDINTYLKSWKLPDSEFTKEKKVTLKNLLNHSAGITVHGFLGYSSDLPVPTLIEVLNGIPPANSGPILVDKVPEESFRYSGGGYNIIQQTMMDIEGNTFPNIMSELVLKPLDMNQSTYSQPLPKEQLKFAATGYLPDGSMTKGKRHTYPEMAPAGLWTTAEDLAKFAVNIQQTLKAESNKALSQEMTAKMLAPFVEKYSGLGIFLKQKKNQTYFGHGGWNEGFSSDLVAHKDKGYGVVVMINSNHPDFINELITSVARTYQWDDYVSTYKKVKVKLNEFKEISGRYKVNGNEIVKVYQIDDKLYTKSLGLESEELIKVSENKYYLRQDDRLVMFKPDDSTAQMTMNFIEPSNGELTNTFIKYSNQKIPMEFLIEGNLEKSIEAYQSLMELDSNDATVNEGNLNILGYRFLSKGKKKTAQAIFKVNTILYPNSSNVYDSYAEACMILEEIDLAIENYKKSYELNPQNSNALKMIQKLQE